MDAVLHLIEQGINMDELVQLAAGSNRGLQRLLDAGGLAKET